MATFDSVKQKLIQRVKSKKSWETSEYYTSTSGRTIVDFTAQALYALEQKKKNVQEETFLSSSKLISTIRTLCRTLGVRISRKIPAEVDVTVLYEQDRPLVIPAYHEFMVAGIPFYNYIPFFIPANESVGNLALREGTNKNITYTGDGTDSQIVVTEEFFNVSDYDVRIRSAGQKVRVVSFSFDKTEKDDFVLDLTLTTGQAQWIFGDQFAGYVPDIGENINISYYLTQGGDLDFSVLEDALTNKVPVEYTNNDVVITIYDIHKGANEKELTTYKNVANLAHSSRNRSVTREDFISHVVLQPNVIDCDIRSQRHMSPKNMRLMNMVQLSIVAEDDLTDTQYGKIVDYLRYISSPNVYFVRRDPIPIDIDISVEVYITELDQTRDITVSVENTLREFLRKKYGVINKNVYLSDIYKIIRRISPIIDYVEIQDPTRNLILDYKSLVLSTNLLERYNILHSAETWEDPNFEDVVQVWDLTDPGTNDVIEPGKVILKNSNLLISQDLKFASTNALYVVFVIVKEKESGSLWLNLTGTAETAITSTAPDPELEVGTQVRIVKAENLNTHNAVGIQCKNFTGVLSHLSVRRVNGITNVVKDPYFAVAPGSSFWTLGNSWSRGTNVITRSSSVNAATTITYATDLVPGTYVLRLTITSYTDSAQTFTASLGGSTETLDFDNTENAIFTQYAIFDVTDTTQDLVVSLTGVGSKTVADIYDVRLIPIPADYFHGTYKLSYKYSSGYLETQRSNINIDIQHNTNIMEFSWFPPEIPGNASLFATLSVEHPDPDIKQETHFEAHYDELTVYTKTDTRVISTVDLWKGAFFQQEEPATSIGNSLQRNKASFSDFEIIEVGTPEHVIENNEILLTVNQGKPVVLRKNVYLRWSHIHIEFSVFHEQNITLTVTDEVTYNDIECTTLNAWTTYSTSLFFERDELLVYVKGPPTHSAFTVRIRSINFRFMRKGRENIPIETDLPSWEYEQNTNDAITGQNVFYARLGELNVSVLPSVRKEAPRLGTEKVTRLQIRQSTGIFRIRATVDIFIPVVTPNILIGRPTISLSAFLVVLRSSASLSTNVISSIGRAVEIKALEATLQIGDGSGGPGDVTITIDDATEVTTNSIYLQIGSSADDIRVEIDNYAEVIVPIDERLRGRLAYSIKSSNLLEHPDKP